MISARAATVRSWESRGAVEIRVMQENHVSIADPSRGPGGDPLGRPSASSFPHRDHSNGRRPAARAARRPGEGLVDPVRRPMDGGRLPDRILDRSAATNEIRAQFPPAQPQLQSVAVPMERDDVPAGGDIGEQRGPAHHLLADDEEDRSRARAREEFEHGRGAHGVRPVVEGEHDAGRRRRGIAAALEGFDRSGYLEVDGRT